MWHKFPCDHDEPIWTCSILPNEIFFDWDAPNWDDAYREAIKVDEWAIMHDIEIETAFSGSKSIHQSFYFDPSSLEIPKDMYEDLKDVDVARVVRLTMLELVKEAGVDTRAGGLDTAKMRFSKDTKGSMKRIYGSTKQGKPPKTWFARIPKDKPESYLLTYPPELPELFSLEPWKAKILAQLRDEIERMKNYDADDYNIPLELAQIKEKPWWKWMLRPPEGFHDIALASIVLLLKDIGMAESDVVGLMVDYWTPKEACQSPSHQPTNDVFQRRIGHIYRSPLHFSARRFQEEMQEHGMISTMESRRKFLEGFIKSKTDKYLTTADSQKHP
jgi:hypothetical protein